MGFKTSPMKIFVKPVVQIDPVVKERFNLYLQRPTIHYFLLTLMPVVDINRQCTIISVLVLN